MTAWSTGASVRKLNQKQLKDIESFMAAVTW
jgi:hypothetical protein